MIENMSPLGPKTPQSVHWTKIECQQISTVQVLNMLIDFHFFNKSTHYLELFHAPSVQTELSMSDKLSKTCIAVLFLVPKKRPKMPI